MSKNHFLVRLERLCVLSRGRDLASQGVPFVKREGTRYLILEEGGGGRRKKEGCVRGIACAYIFVHKCPLSTWCRLDRLTEFAAIARGWRKEEGRISDGVSPCMIRVDAPTPCDLYSTFCHMKLTMMTNSIIKFHSLLQSITPTLLPTKISETTNLSVYKVYRLGSTAMLYFHAAAQCLISQVDGSQDMDASTRIHCHLHLQPAR